MNIETESLEILIAHSNPETLSTLDQAVQELDHQIVDLVQSGEDIIKACEKHEPDLVISGVHMPDMDGIRALTLIGKENPVPGIIVTPKTDLELVEAAALDHIMAWMVEPLCEQDLGPTILLVYRRFEEFAELRKENQDLRIALIDRKVIERAKGILMKSASLNEGDAFRQLQKLASNKRMKLIDIAQAIIHAEGALDIVSND
ncbi:ANTAR domain-containing response regulator [Gimesia aquarii]|uniref:Putative transcriptional regulatory protein pdtaR n=1 Tax=Gimesia aquarii TaxID=2527964 RepID=A0A517WX42_9PLAN|nr:ANTAR domain-containing protein [Gimesia aquarii]QDU09814.1 putative transcriptional regulatory protein pdtaR [Gimesia aquarii]